MSAQSILGRVRRWLRERDVHAYFNREDKRGRIWLGKFGSVGGEVSIRPSLSMGGYVHLADRGEDDLSFHVEVLGIAAWLSFDLKATRFGRREKWGAQRHLFRRHFDNTFQWWLGADTDGWSSSSPKWRDGFIFLDDAVLGKADYSSKELDRREVVIPMPERSYQATAILTESTWKRPRWPWPKVIKSVELKIAEPIPIPGKGENAWDCDDDALYGGSYCARTIEEGIGIAVGDLLRTRQKRSGTHRPPSEERAA